jgi:hypothetical protein
MEIKKTAIIFNGFIHDFAAGIWLATIVTISVLHDAHLKEPSVVGTLNHLERCGSDHGDRGRAYVHLR